MGSKWRLAVAGVAVTALAVVAACGDDDDDAGGTSSTTTTEVEQTSTTEAETTTTLSVEAQVLRDYEASVLAFSAASNPPNPDHPDLLARWTGEALASVQDRLRSRLAQGVGSINSVETHPTVVSTSGDVAMVEDCFVDRTQLVQLATGETGEPSETVGFVTTRMELVAGVWKVAQRTGSEDPCEPG